MFLFLTAVTITLEIPDEYKGAAVAKVQMVNSQEDIDRLCGKAAPGFEKLGCQFDGSNLIVTGNPCNYPEASDPNSYARLMCHEKAHLKGWRHTDN